MAGASCRFRTCVSSMKRMRPAGIHPPHIPFLAGRDRSVDEGAAGTDVSCFHPDDDEHRWTGDGVIEARSQQKGRRNGAQAGCGERLNADFSYGEFLGVCRSGQIFASC